MNGIKQRFKPKHQVLILKCYPRLPKNSSAAEIKPNGSELSYLLFYASSRKSKLTKVGTFLEKRTTSDLYKSRSASVQVTLQILTACLNNPGIGGGGPEGFGLFAPFVLRILRDVLKSGNDTALIESAVPTWDSFCRHQDHVALSADHEYRSLFAEVVRLWAGYATKEHGTHRTATRRPGSTDSVKLRFAGLSALKSIADSDALGTEAGRQLETVMPVVLQNVYGSDAELKHLLNMQGQSEAFAKEQAARTGRPSMVAGRSTFDNGDVRAAEGTAAEADRLADEETSVLALQVLKSISGVENRQQTRSATSYLLRFVTTQSPSASSEKMDSRNLDSAWSITLFETVCNWTPVQDRFVAVFTAVEMLVRSPIKEDQLDRQLLLARILAHVFGSDINLIGLSVMDVLLGILQHVLLILQLGTTGTYLPSGNASSDEDAKGRTSADVTQKLDMEVVKTPSPARLQLLGQLRLCIANLAVHVYYTDQISDMVSAILLRLKPTPTTVQNPAVTASAIEDPSTAAAEVASQSSLRERPNTDGFFSFDTAREVALSAVKDVILTANSSRTDNSYVSENRNGVPISVWEGTQWLLRDNSFEVRKAYVDVLCTWLKLELRKTNLRLEEDSPTTERKRRVVDGQIVSRAASTASNKTRAARQSRSTFLQLLHLAIYENALQHGEAADGEADLLLLHLLLVSLARSLGINAVKVGLPMIFRLQEDASGLTEARAQVMIGSLVYGYIWALTEIFELDATPAARDILPEITRRRNNKAWIEAVQMPPTQLDQIAAIRRARTAPASVNLSAISLVPYGDRAALIEALQNSYFASLMTPPTSPPASPPRTFVLPQMDTELSSTPSGSVTPQPDNKAFNQSTIDELNAPWSRDALLAALAANAPRPGSLTGSARGGPGTKSPNPATALNGNSYMPTGYGSLLRGEHRHLLAATNTFPYQRSREGSPRASGTLDADRQPSFAGSATSMRDRIRLRSRSRRAAGSPNATDDGRRFSETTSQGRRAVSTSARVDELKRVLATGGAGVGLENRRSYDAGDDTGSDSLVDVDESFGTFGDDDASLYNRPDAPAADLGVQNVAARDMVSPAAANENLSDPVDRDVIADTDTPPAAVQSQPHFHADGAEVQPSFQLTGDNAHDSSVIDAAFGAASSAAASVVKGLGLGFAATTKPAAINDHGDDEEKGQGARMVSSASAPMLRLNSDELPVEGANGNGNGRGVNGGRSVSGPLGGGGGKVGLSELLGRIPDEDEEEGGSGIGRPPY
ncbi:hypothetical protein MBLNU457_6398t1 [Dothideomycetes sp. NU457]